MMDQLFLGIDGGGSGTRARLEDAGGRVLGRGAGGPGNIRLGIDSAWDSILTAAAAALAEAGLARSMLASVNAGLGLAGACLGQERADFLRHRQPFASVALASDAEAACLGAHAGAPGGIVIVGTGSVAHVWDGSRGRQIGGWGFPISDGGSGAWIGLEAVRRSLHALDPPETPSPLQDLVLQRFNHDPEAAVHWAAAASTADYAALAPLVVRQAGQGDATAVAIMQAAAAEIAGLLRSVMAAGAGRVALLGGLAASMLPWLPADLGARLCPPQGGGLEGALLLIRQKLALDLAR